MQLPLIVADHEVFLEVVFVGRIVRFDDFHADAYPLVLFVLSALLPLPVIAAFVKHNPPVHQTHHHFVGHRQVLDAGAARILAQVDCSLCLPIVTAPLAEGSILRAGYLTELFYVPFGLQTDFGDARHHFRVNSGTAWVVGTYFVLF